MILRRGRGQSPDSRGSLPGSSARTAAVRGAESPNTSPKPRWYLTHEGVSELDTGLEILGENGLAIKTVSFLPRVRKKQF